MADAVSIARSISKSDERIVVQFGVSVEISVGSSDLIKYELGLAGQAHISYTSSDAEIIT
jgi:hypothetical protein